MPILFARRHNRNLFRSQGKRAWAAIGNPHAAALVSLFKGVCEMSESDNEVRRFDAESWYHSKFLEALEMGE